MMASCSISLILSYLLTICIDLLPKIAVFSDLQNRLVCLAVCVCACVCSHPIILSATADIHSVPCLNCACVPLTDMEINVKDFLLTYIYIYFEYCYRGNSDSSGDRTHFALN